MTELDAPWVFLSRLALKGEGRPTQGERADAITRLGVQLSKYEGRASLSGLARTEISVCLRVFGPSVEHASDVGLAAIREALGDSGLDEWYKPTTDPRFPKVIAR